jgi:hypothetical protein
MYHAPLLAVGAGAGRRMFHIPIGSYHSSPSGRSNSVNKTKRSPRLIRGLKRLYIFIIPYYTSSYYSIFPLHSATVAIIALCANVSLVAKEARDFKLLCPQL